MRAGLKDKLLPPELLEAFVAEFLKEWNAAARDGEAGFARSRRELAETERKIEAILKAIEVYRRKVEKLEAALNEPDVRHEAAEALRALIEKIVLTPGEPRGEMRAERFGELGAILALGEAGRKNRTPDVGVRLSVVAGAGFETYLTEPQRISLVRAA